MAGKSKMSSMIKKVPIWGWVVLLGGVWLVKSKLASGSTSAIAPASTPESEAFALYAKVKNHPSLVGLAIYKQYLPAIDKLLAKKDYKNAMVYLKWLAAKIPVAK